MRFSIVITTFQRRHIVCRAIDSALSFSNSRSDDTEVIVVDDASQDGTADMIRSSYAQELESGRLILLQRQTNGGETVAKNEGARAARGNWVIILDSDDELLADAATAIPNTAAANPNAPLLMFRCKDEMGRLCGPLVPPGPMPFYVLLEGALGEHLPVLNREAFLTCPYDQDFRGFVGLTYLRMLQRFGPAIVSDAVVRRYYTASGDRLCTMAERLRRADSMARGFARWLDEFGQLLPWRRRMGLRLRWICYRLAATLPPAIIRILTKASGAISKPSHSTTARPRIITKINPTPGRANSRDTP